MSLCRRALAPLLLLTACAAAAARPREAPDATGGQSLLERCAPTGRAGTYAAEIVDAAAEGALGDALRRPFGLRDQATFEAVVDRFYKGRGDDYDFLYLYVPDADFGAAGLHVFVAPRSASALGVYDRGLPELSARHPRLKSVMILALPRDWGGGPSLHELAHYWGNGLGSAPALGFPADSHWGATGVSGQLGGFDSGELRCREPRDAKAPDCARDAEGRYDVYMPPFGETSNGGDFRPYGALELYLMGLVPAEEVPPIAMLEDPRRLNGKSGTAWPLYSVAGTHTITAAEISAAMGGPPPARLDADHPLRAAFALVNGEKSPEKLEQLAKHARAFGDVELASQVSYCRATGGRARIRTDL